MEETLEYRAATTAEIDWLTDTFLAALRDAITGARGYWDEAKERDQFQQQLKLPHTFMIHSQRRALGFYTAWPEQDHFFVGTLCIAPEHQSRGVGAAAMRAIAARVPAMPLRLSVLKSNPRARRFYERLGCRWMSATQYHDHFMWPNPFSG